MIYKICAALIVGFWLLMTGLLIRLEVAPDRSAVLAVPVTHVVKMIFAHEQPSVLNIVQNGLPVGLVSVIPSAHDGTRTVKFSGNLWLRVPTLAKQRVLWEGVTEMDQAFNMRSTQFTLTLRDPAWRIAIELDKGALHYALTENGGVIARDAIPLTRAGAENVIQLIGLDPNVLAAFSQNTTPPQVTAKQTGRSFHGEKVSVFQISFRQGETALADIYVSQLGQVLEATTAFGYALMAQD